MGEESEANSREEVLLVVAVDRAWCKLVRRPDRSMVCGGVYVVLFAGTRFIINRGTNDSLV